MSLQNRHLIMALVALALVAICCLWAINWRKAWPVLRAGGWIALVLLTVMTAYAWMLARPSSLNVAGVTLPNYLWQLIAVSLMVGFGLFCGYLQGVQGWEPEVISLDPPEHSEPHGHHH